MDWTRLPNVEKINRFVHVIKNSCTLEYGELITEQLIGKLHQKIPLPSLVYKLTKRRGLIKQDPIIHVFRQFLWHKLEDGLTTRIALLILNSIEFNQIITSCMLSNGATRCDDVCLGLIRKLNPEGQRITLSIRILSGYHAGDFLTKSISYSYLDYIAVHMLGFSKRAKEWTQDISLITNSLVLCNVERKRNCRITEFIEDDKISRRNKAWRRLCTWKHQS